MFDIRPANIHDAECLFQFVKTLDSENDYLLYNQNERLIDEKITRNYLTKIENNNKSIVLVAINENNHIIGFLCGEVSHLKRINHVLKANVGVLKLYHGLGIGRLLVDRLINHAKASNIVRIEVTVIKENKLSLNLCKKFGFEIEGIKKNSIKIEERFHDEYLLSKLLVDEVDKSKLSDGSNI